MAQLDLTSNTPAFLNTPVTVTRTPDGGGNACHGKYQVTYYQPGGISVNEHGSISVVSTNTILNFQLIAPTPSEVVFTGMRTNQNDVEQQFSEATISLDGKMLTFTDIDNSPGGIAVTLLWRDSVEISHDPQVVNTPQP